MLTNQRERERERESNCARCKNLKSTSLKSANINKSKNANLAQNNANLNESKNTNVTPKNHATLPQNRLYIIIPIYNVAPYLRECLDSIRSQTYANLCAIMVDDCSSDESAQIAKRFAQSDTRFILIQKPRNEGIAMARNTGLEYIFSTLKICQTPQTSAYIGFVDSDDVIAQDYFANLISCLQSARKSRNKRDIMVAKSFNIYRFNDSDYNRAMFAYRSDKIWWHKLARYINGTMEGITTKGGKVEAWRALYRAEFLRPLRFARVRLGEDITFGNVVNARAGQIAYTRKARYFYRQRAGSLMQKYAYCYDEAFANFAYMLESFVKFDLLKSHKIDISLVANIPLGRENECFAKLQNLVCSYHLSEKILRVNPHLKAILDSKTCAEFRATIANLVPFSKRFKRYFRIDIRFSRNSRKIYIKLFGKVLLDKSR